ncbi:MAG: carbohydrate-binding domain-containing protein, partial [Enterococcus sp.]|nr:carbohydrate-binding domain-containing protein [Enterococcus sp.]
MKKLLNSNAFKLTVALLIMISSVLITTGCEESDTYNLSKLRTVDFTARDMENDSAIDGTIVLNQDNSMTDTKNVSIDGNVITVKKSGNYKIKGSLTDGQLLIDGKETDKVGLVLENACITCKTGPAIKAGNIKKLFITLADGTKNEISDGKNYTLTDDEPFGAIFAKGDLTVNGTGKLIVNGNYKNGIVSKDDLKITNGEIVVNATNSCIRATEDLGICGGKFTLIAGNDGVHSNQTTYINGGSFNIKKSYEGIEGTQVYINNADISINSSDDGINAAGGNDGSSKNPFDFKKTAEPNPATSDNTSA